MRLDRKPKARPHLVAAIVLILVLTAGAAVTMLSDKGDTLFLIASGLLASGQTREDTLGPHAEIVRPAAVIGVALRSPVEVRAFPGTVHPARSSRLAFRVSGPLVTLPVQEGEEVGVGTLLARIDPRDFELAVADLTARLEAADAARRLAEINHGRQEELVRRRAVPVANLDSALAERDRAVAEVESVLHQLATAQAALDDTRLVAPSGGRVAALHVELHDYVTARAPVLTFHDTAATDLIVNLPETMIPRLPAVTGIEVTVADRPGRLYAAEIREMASELAADTGAYTTALRISDLDGPAPLAGLSGTARFHIAETTSASGREIMVPSSAVFAGPEGGNHVWVVTGDPSLVTARPVTVVGIDGDHTRLVGGLAQGERIVAYGVHFLREGQRVRPLDGAGLAMGGEP